MNGNKLNKMIENWKMVYKEKADQLQKRSDRKYGIKKKKRPVEKRKEDDKYDIL